MANETHVKVLRQSTIAWNAWRRQHPDILPDLSYAELSKSNLHKANFRSTDLRGANLSGANLRDTNLRGANLSGANLSGADLHNADLSFAILIGVNLHSATFYATRLGSTIFAQVDLCTVDGLDTATHRGPSFVDVKTVKFPRGDTYTRFLQGTGFPDSFIDYLPSLLTDAIQYASCFISYANPDEALARRLYKNLQDKGVRCWMAPHDLRPGDYHHSRIDEAIYLHEKVLLLLSKYAVNSSWVEHEVQIALVREINQKRTILFPLRLDEAVMRTNKDWAVRLRESRHIGNFTRWQDKTAYQEAFTALLQHLKVAKPPTASS